MADRNAKTAKVERELLDRELDDLPANLRWREWMNRIEAVIFASAKPVARDMLQKVVGLSANLDLLVADIQSDLKGRPYELVAVTGGWMHRTRAQYADAIRVAADIGDQELGCSDLEMAVLCAIAYHQPISRSDLNELFGKEISRDLLSRLRYKDLIINGPRSPKPGSAHTFVTTRQFLVTFDLPSLRDLPPIDELEHATDEKQVMFI